MSVQQQFRVGWVLVGLLAVVWVAMGLLAAYDQASRPDLTIPEICGPGCSGQ